MDVESKRSVQWWRSEYKANVWDEPPWYIVVLVKINYLVMITMAILAEWLRSLNLIQSPGPKERIEQKDFVPLDDPFVTLYVNNLYRMGSDVVNRPLCGPPSVIMKVKERVTKNYGWSYEFTGTTKDVINMGSYNYLGMSGNGIDSFEDVTKTTQMNGIGICGCRHEFGNSKLHRKLDQLMAEFLGVEDAICFPMGYSTNTMNISAFVDKDCLVLSDQMNHTSLVHGSRQSGAQIVVFKHNDTKDVEKKLLSCLLKKKLEGKSYKKILIIVEGVYSMEGTIVNLPEFIKIKKRYNSYLFVDEAHSIGALGPHGRGVVEYWGCDPNDVDILMGTLTKSFAAAGGYIAGKKATVQYLKAFGQNACYGAVMSPPLIAHISKVIKVLIGEGGTTIGLAKRHRLIRNSRYLRNRLKQLGFLVYGQNDSPVVPIITYFASKAVCFGRETLKRGIGVVSVVFPATPWTKSRARLCVSADHTKEQLDREPEVFLAPEPVHLTSPNFLKELQNIFYIFGSTKVIEVLNDVGDLTASKYGTVVRPVDKEIDY